MNRVIERCTIEEGGIGSNNNGSQVPYLNNSQAALPLVEAPLAPLLARTATQGGTSLDPITVCASRAEHPKIINGGWRRGRNWIGVCVSTVHVHVWLWRSVCTPCRHCCTYVVNTLQGPKEERMQKFLPIMPCRSLLFNPEQMTRGMRTVCTTAAGQLYCIQTFHFQRQNSHDKVEGPIGNYVVDLDKYMQKSRLPLLV